MQTLKNETVLQKEEKIVFKYPLLYKFAAVFVLFIKRRRCRLRQCMKLHVCRKKRKNFT